MNYLSWEFRKPYIDIGIKKFCNLMTFIFREKDIAGWMIAWFLHYIPYFYIIHGSVYNRYQVLRLYKDFQIIHGSVL